MCLLLQCDDSVSNSMPDTRKGESETWKKQNIMCTLDHKRIPHITCTCIIQVYYNEHLLTIETFRNFSYMYLYMYNKVSQ